MFKSFCTGNLVADAKTFEAGQRNGAHFTIGVRTSTKDKQTNEYLSNFVDVTVFGPQVDSCARLVKGDKVTVSGNACVTPYVSRDGKTGVNISLLADSVDFMFKPRPQDDMFT